MAASPERSRKVARSTWLVMGLSGLALAVHFLMLAPLYGEDHDTITGRVVNGTSGGPKLGDLEATLHIFGQGGDLDVSTAITDRDGQFHFQDVVVDTESTYAVTASYQGVLYSITLDPTTPWEPAELVVYETTSSLEPLHVDADALLLGGADRASRSLLAFEVVRLVNGGDRTFVPDLSQPGNMNFLRFSLPAGARDLEVSSDLPGDRIINVGTGFALTAPVTPGTHQLTYTYRIPYRGNLIVLSHSFPIGTKNFRLLLDDTSGELKESGLLTLQSKAEMQGKSYTAWGTSQLSPGTRLNLKIGNLPQPSSLRRLGDALADGPYLKIGMPGALGVVLAVLLLYSTFFRHTSKSSAGRGVAAAGMIEGTSSSPWDVEKPERRVLVEEIAGLDDQFQRGEIDQVEHWKRRQDLKERLLRLAFTSEVE